MPQPTGVTAQGGYDVINGVDQRDLETLQRNITMAMVGSGTNVAVANGTLAFCVPLSMNNMRLVDVVATVYTAGGGAGTTDVVVRRSRAGVDVDMLAAPVTLAAGVFSARNGTISPVNFRVQTGDLVFVDVDAINGVAPQGLSVTMTFLM